MGLRKALTGCLCVALLGAPAVAWAAEAGAAPPDLEALKKQLSEWRTHERELRAEIEAIGNKLKESPEVAPLRKAAQETDDAYQGKKKTDPAYLAALKAEEEADDALDKLVDAKLADNAEAAALRKELATLDDRAAQLEFDRALVELELSHRYSPINRALAKDPELQNLRAAYDEADRAYRADKANKPARDQARKAYYDAVEAKKRAMPEGQKLYDRLAETRKERDALGDTKDQAGSKLREMRRTIERGDDPAIAAAREKEDAADDAVRAAYNGGEIQAAREARDAARHAYAEKLKELMAADEKVAQLTKERETLRDNIHDAEKAIRAEEKGEK